MFNESTDSAVSDGANSSDTSTTPSGAPAKPYRGGPRTPEGKARSAYNGLKHGLTGRTVVLPTEDMAAYRKFSEDLVESFAPGTGFERQLAQTIADTQWRLNRARSWEDGMLCVGAFGPAGDMDVENPQVHAALVASQVFQQDSKSFVNLTLYEQRLHRQQKQAFEQLEKLQSQRKAEEQAALEKAKLIHKMHKMQGTVQDVKVREFAFSSARLDAECAWDCRLEQARIARIVDYNLKHYEARVARMAA